MSHNIQKELYFDKAIALRDEEGLTFRDIEKIIPVSSATIYRWCTNFAREKSTRKPMSKKKRVASPAVKPVKGKEAEALRAENERLSRELKYERLRADFYNEMINVAEKQFDISIRKKAGARQ